MKSQTLQNPVINCARLCFIFLTLFCFSRAAIAQTASVITFEDVPEGNLNSIAYSSGVYKLEDGALSESLYIRGATDGYASKSIFNTNYDRIIRLRKNDNTAFTLTSFDYGGNVWGDFVDATVTGYYAGGGTVTDSFTSTVKTYAALNLNWSNLQKVEINFSGGVSTAFGALDNFAVTDESASATDTEAPSVPAGLSSSGITTESFIVSWSPSSDNVGVAGYQVFVDGVLKSSTTTTSLLINGLLPATAYAVTVTASDAAGNASAASSPLTVNTANTSAFPVITARGENPPNEGKEKAFDGDNYTKWLDFNATSWIQIQYATPAVYNQYVIVSGNDFPGRDPKNWTLQASDDGINWVILSTKIN